MHHARGTQEVQDVHVSHHRRRAAARRALPAFMTFAIGAALVVAIPFVARHLDGSADEFSTDSVPILPAIGWLICAILGAIVLTHRLQLVFKVDEGTAVALAYDGLPVLLLVTPIIALWALAAGHVLLAAFAGLLALYWAVIVGPRLFPERRTPRWITGAPRFRLAVANVYVDNETPRDAADQLVACGADVVLIAEATPAFMQVFDEAGGTDAYPHRVFDPEDTTDYAVAIVSRLPLGERSRVEKDGPLTLIMGEVCVEGITVTVAGLNPMATLDPGGHATWKQQIDILCELIPTIPGPLVIAGDLNMTSYRPEFRQLLKIGLSDAIDSLGKALKPSFSLKSVPPFGAFGAIARLDHALVNDRVRAVELTNMQPCGSDHTPFVITLALRSGAS